MENPLVQILAENHMITSQYSFLEWLLACCHIVVFGWFIVSIILHLFSLFRSKWSVEEKAKVGNAFRHSITGIILYLIFLWLLYYANNSVLSFLDISIKDSFSRTYDIFNFFNNFIREVIAFNKNMDSWNNFYNVEDMDLTGYSL